MKTNFSKADFNVKKKIKAKVYSKEAEKQVFLINKFETKESNIKVISERKKKTIKFEKKCIETKRMF